MKQNIGEQPSGKLMDVVFYQRFGKTYVRAAPIRRASYIDEQLLYRQRMSKASTLWRSIKSEETSKIWNSAAEGMNNYSWFMKDNLPALAMDGSLIDPKLIKVSDGKLPLPQTLEAKRMPGDDCAMVISWQNDSHSGPERLKDELLAMSYADGKFSKITATGLKRADQGGRFTLPDKPAKASHVFLFVASENGEGYSISICIEI